MHLAEFRITKGCALKCSIHPLDTSTLQQLETLKNQYRASRMVQPSTVSHSISTGLPVRSTPFVSSHPSTTLNSSQKAMVPSAQEPYIQPLSHLLQQEKIVQCIKPFEFLLNHSNTWSQKLREKNLEKMCNYTLYYGNGFEEIETRIYSDPAWNKKESKDSIHNGTLVCHGHTCLGLKEPLCARICVLPKKMSTDSDTTFSNIMSFEDDDDLEIIDEGPLSVKCPCSFATLKHPFVSLSCGHVMDESSLNYLIQGNGSLPKPWRNNIPKKWMNSYRVICCPVCERILLAVEPCVYFQSVLESISDSNTSYIDYKNEKWVISDGKIKSV